MALALCAGLSLAACVQTQTVAPGVVIVTEPQRSSVTYAPASSPWEDPVRRYSRSLGGAFIPYYPYPYSARFGFAYGWPWTASYAGWPGPYFPPGRWTYYPWYGWSPLAHAPWPGAWQAAALNDPRYPYEPPFQREPDVLPVAYARPPYPSYPYNGAPSPHAPGLRTPPGAVSSRLVEDFRAYRRPPSPALSNSAFRRPPVAGAASSRASGVRSAGQGKPGLSRTHASGLRAPSSSSRSPARTGGQRNVAPTRPAPRAITLPEH